MISRTAATLLAECYALHFRNSLAKTVSILDGEVHRLYEQKLNTFLFEQDYEPWFLHLMKSNIQLGNDRQLVRTIMEIHTGETLIPASLDWSNERREELGQKLLRKLAEDIFKLYETIPITQLDYSKAKTKRDKQLLESLAKAGRPAADLLEKLRARLEIDGYVYVNSQLHRTESSVIDEQAEQTYLEVLVDSLHLSDAVTIKHHVRLSEEHYVANKWDDSISNSRKVLDAILKQVAVPIYLKVNKTAPPPALLKNATDTRIFLERQRIITTGEREALEKNYGLLSATGGHPYIAEKDQARLMRHLALTFSQFVLLRYQGFLKKNP